MEVREVERLDSTVLANYPKRSRNTCICIYIYIRYEILWAASDMPAASESIIKGGTTIVLPVTYHLRASSICTVFIRTSHEITRVYEIIRKA